MNELFRSNEHGDIWQEPTLFDQSESRFKADEAETTIIIAGACQLCGGPHDCCPDND